MVFDRFLFASSSYVYILHICFPSRFFFSRVEKVILMSESFWVLVSSLGRLRRLVFSAGL